MFFKFFLEEPFLVEFKFPENEPSFSKIVIFDFIFEFIG